MKSLDLNKVLKKQRKFARDRKWEKYHTPKNLSMALAIEAAELMEIFQWLNSQEVKKLLRSPTQKQAVADELSDIFYYLMRLADICEVNIEKSFWKKMEKNERKYPVKLARGNAKKYTEYK